MKHRTFLRINAAMIALGVLSLVLFPLALTMVS